MWKDIIGYENYEINEYGDIRNKVTNRILSPYISNKGYKLIDLSKNGIKTKYSIHKLVAIHFVPNPYNLPIVLHKDNIKTNTYYKNLEWGTYSENNRQAIKDGLNTVPRPDNRKYYEIYNPHYINDRVVCYGINEVIEKIGYIPSDSGVRSLITRESTIRDGEYKGFKIRKINIIKPISFNKKVNGQRSALDEGGYKP